MVAPENFHLTVAFLGGVDGDRVADVIAAVGSVAPSLSPISVPMNAIGAFPNERRPRVVWVGSGVPVPAFGRLCGVVRSALAALDFSFDRHADPHVTIARANGTAALPRLAPPVLEPLRIHTLTVYESFTEPAGARYQALERIRLG
jgi:2'-5' RNA ligase